MLFGFVVIIISVSVCVDCIGSSGGDRVMRSDNIVFNEIVMETSIAIITIVIVIIIVVRVIVVVILVVGIIIVIIIDIVISVFVLIVITNVLNIIIAIIIVVVAVLTDGFHSLLVVIMGYGSLQLRRLIVLVNVLWCRWYLFPGFIIAIVSISDVGTSIVSSSER